MKGLRVSIFFLCFFSFVTKAAESAKDKERAEESKYASLMVKAVDLAKTKDYLGLRIFFKRELRVIRDDRTWRKLRRLLQEVPQVGLDVVFWWEHRRPKGGGKVSDAETFILRADEMMLAQQFEQALQEYQKAALIIKEENRRFKREDPTLNYVLHYMGRALYGAGRFEDSTKVFGWVSPDYWRFRQVLFERMWAAFRAGRPDLALGAIASQRSSYFSEYLDPEAYLVQIYMLKKLCREEDLIQALNEMKKFKKAIESDPKVDVSLGDINFRILENLKDEKYMDLKYSYAREFREREQKQIASRLKSVVQVRKQRIVAGIDTVLAYSQIAVAGSAGLKPIEKLDDRTELAEKNLEIWAADSAEDWVDEIGYHRFMGDTKCPGTLKEASL